MPSLASCIKKLDIDPDDSARAKELSAQYLADGMDKAEAEQEAVSDVLKEIRTERTDAVKQITEAGGRAPSRAKAAKAPVEEVEPQAPVTAEPATIKSADRIEQKGATYDRENATIQQLDAFEEAAGGDLLASSGLSIEERIQQAKDNSRLLVKSAEKAKIKHGANTVESAEDAAHILASIRKSAQEGFYALVLDKNGKPLSVIDHSKGGIDSASVYFGTVASTIAETQDAYSVWLAHNHPSGNPTPSSADYGITKRLVKSIESLGVTVDGHVILGDGTSAFAFKDDSDGRSILNKPRLRTSSTPVTHRVIRKRLGEGAALTSPGAARSIINDVEASDAVILLDTQNKVITSVSLSADEVAKMAEKGVAKRLAGLVSATNASAAIFKTKEFRPEASANLATFAERVDIRLLDYFYESDGPVAVSDAEKGGVNITAGDTLFRIDNSLQSVSKTGFTQAQTEKAIGQTLDKVSDSLGITVNVVSSENIPANIKSQIPKGKRPKGFAVGNTVYLVNDHLSNAADAQVTLAHELKGHVGVNNIIENWSEVEDLYTNLKGKTFDSIQAEVEKRNPGADNLTQIKEFIAIAAERRETEGPVGGFMRKVREFLKKALNAMGFKPISMTNIDLILSRSEAYLAGDQQVSEDMALQFKLEEEERQGAEAKGLPMDKASRMARAEEMGFDTSKVWYHGTASDIKRFEPSYFTQDKKLAGEFAEMRQDQRRDKSGANVIPVYINTTNMTEVELSSGHKYPDGKTLRLAKETGASVVIVKDVPDYQGVSDQLYAFNPSDIRSVNAAFDPDYAESPELLFSLDRDIGFDAPVEKRVDTVIRKFQDKFKPVLMTQKEITKTKGEEINETEDAYLAEELFYGKTEEDLRVLREEYIKPLAEKLAEYDISREELDEWLIANHAKERNKQIAKINPAMRDGGSGMTNAEATRVHNMATPNKRKQLDELSQYVYDMLEHKRQLMRDGLQTDEMTDAWESAYKNYVPLKGMAENEEATGAKIGRGFDIRGKETMRAMGRRSQAESPTLHTIRDVTETQIRFRKNEVGNKILALVENNPNPEYWEIFTEDSPDTTRRIIRTKAGDEVRETPINMQAEKDKYFATKRDGMTYYIKSNDARLIRALQNMGPEPLNVVFQALGTVTRFLSSMSTSYNPEFMVSNVSRDVQTAILNLMAEQDIPGGRAKGKELVGSMVKSIPAAMRAIHASLRGKELKGKSAEWQKTFEQFREDGAKTGWFDMKEVDQQAADLNNMISMASGGAAGNLRKFAEGVKDFVDNANTAVENAVRLSVYKHAIDSGVTRKKAASLAKNLTVNFNRKGELGAVMNTLFMFTNAAIQGTAVFARAMGTMKRDPNAKMLPVIGKSRMNAAQKVASGMVGAAFMLSMLNREMSGDDDDGVNLFDKVPAHVRERNIVIMKSIFGGEAGKYWTIPLPYGFNIFYVMGDTAEAAVNSDYRSGEELSTHMVMSLLGSFAPIGFESSKDAEKAILKTITPTVGKPFMQLAVNENFYGGSIFKENSAYGVQRPDSALAKRNTKPHWQTISTFLNEVTGGSAFRKGYIDISPDTLGHLFDFTTGGAGKFASLTAGAMAKGFKGEEMEDREVPFFRKVSGEVQEYGDQSRFYDRANKVKQFSDELKSLKGEERRKFRKENFSIVRQAGRVKAAEKALTKFRRARKRVELSSLSDKSKEARLEKIEDQMDSIIDRFNKSYDKATQK